MRRTMLSSLGKMPTTMKGQQAFHPISGRDAVSRPRRGAPLHLLVQSFQRVRLMQLGPVPGREGHAGQHVGLGVGHEWPGGH